jgi:glyoxylase-like metal-dependent hydrolase (beta-lactamase superfamily II)
MRWRFVPLLLFSVAALPAAVRQITLNVTMVEGPVNGLLVNRAGKTLAVYGDPREKPSAVQKVLFTHHRRDVAWAGRTLVERGAEAVIPAGEQPLFSDVAQFWNRFSNARFHDYSQQTSKILTSPVSKTAPVRGGDQIKWEGLDIKVLDTPGYTRHAVSYLFEIDGKRIACTGDLIYGDGKILDLYSLQDAIPEAKEDGYHGWAARGADVIASLQKIAQWKPDVIIPARGPAITNPPDAIEKLTRRMRAVFSNHYAIDALRWYRGDERMGIQASRVLGNAGIDWMPMAALADPQTPDWIASIGNSRLILSNSAHAFLVDCGSQKILDEVKKLNKTVDGIFVTHYHDDHTNLVQSAANAFRCPVYASPELRDILENPSGFKMPAQTSNPIRPVSVVTEGLKRRWNEFEFTYFYFPGQTIYHGGLVVKKDGGETVFFAGDSFTPSGIDDYCLLNRNFADPERGFLYCLNLMKKMKPGYLIVNQHVAPAFRFSPQQIDRMMESLRRRTGLLRDLFPWDDPNYGLDEQWARFYPYAVEAASSTSVRIEIAIRNHSPAKRTYRITLHAPEGWEGPRTPIALTVNAREEKFIPVRFTPAKSQAGVHMITADIAFDTWDLREWVEAMVTVTR